MTRLVIWINVSLYIWSGIALVHGATEVYAARNWNLALPGSQLLYSGLLGFAALYTAVCALGLLRHRWWSRSMAFWWNLALAAIIGLLPALIAFWSARLEHIDTIPALRSTDVVMGLIAACLFVALSLILRTRTLQDYFERSGRASEEARHS
ncbi:MAG: hypothetical protein ACYDHM_00510 [Acidiferrobacterales bacterium]